MALLFLFILLACVSAKIENIEVRKIDRNSQLISSFGYLPNGVLILTVKDLLVHALHHLPKVEAYEMGFVLQASPDNGKLFILVCIEE